VKKFVNDPKQFVPEMLEGIALANPDTLTYVPDYNLIMRSDAPREDKVSIVQGSGSGHEPAHVMVVGKGMLDAACPGDVFAAPPMDYVYETAKKLASPKGVLLLVNNYTGDRMAFDMGKEMAESEGVRTEILMINDDVAVKDSTYTIGRRGVAGNFFVIKAVGAASERGDDLEEIVRIGKKVNDVTRTMGVALTACTPPAKGSRCSRSARTRWRSASASTASRAGSAASWPPRMRSPTSFSRPWSPTCRTTLATGSR
jgi:dihydroxyacetone kinase-like protein